MAENTTTDGYRLTTVEQEGEYAGEEMGRVWVRIPTAHASQWVYYGFGSVEHATKAVEDATDLSYAQFDQIFTQGE